jgi:hypothetical protein
MPGLEHLVIAPWLLQMIDTLAGDEKKSNKSFATMVTAVNPAISARVEERHVQ